MKKINIITLSFLLLITFASCQKWDTPKPIEPVVMNATMTISDFKQLYRGAAVAITDENIVLAGVVNSTDRSGNIYKSLYIQDETGGLELKIGKTGLYNDYHQGQTIYVKPAQLYLGAYGGSVQLGAKSNNPKYETSYIEAQGLINRTIFRGSYGEELKPLDITSASELSPSNVCKLVSIKNVRYDGGNAFINNTNTPIDTWGVKEDKDKGIEAAYGQHYFYLGNSKVVVRTSGYARFATQKVELQKGDRANLTGLLTIFNSTYQLILLDLSGVEKL